MKVIRRHIKVRSRYKWLGLVALFWGSFFHFFDTAIYRLDHGDLTNGVLQLLVICGFLPVLATISSILALRHGREEEIPEAFESLAIVAPPEEVESTTCSTSTVLQ